MMYAYSTPEIARHNGWLKIGDYHFFTLFHQGILIHRVPFSFVSGHLPVAHPLLPFSPSVFTGEPTMRSLFSIKCKKSDHENEKNGMSLRPIQLRAVPRQNFISLQREKEKILAPFLW